ncbi:MAG: ATP-binding cassette domain-containing protein [Pseudomonadota bacterium]
MMIVKLIVKTGEVFELQEEGTWLLGRSDDSDICFPNDPYCSRYAVHLTIENGVLWAEPAADGSELTVNGRPVDAATRLADGSQIAFGEQVITIEMDTPQPSVSPPANQSSHGRIEIQDGMVLGRAPADGGVAISHPAISRSHAEFDTSGGDIFVRDLGSTNGTFINGEEIHGSALLRQGDLLSLGPKVFRLSGGVLDLVEQASDEAIAVEGLCVDVPHIDGSGMLRLLNNINVTIGRGEFVCIVGSSGSGKSTLMKAMAARSTPTHGNVRMNGLDLQKNFAALQHDIAMVPQNDVLHQALSLRHALDYSAQLRLPPDLRRHERAELIEHAADAVDLHERLDMQIQHLSGGQKKRASLANETLSDPGILFLDEVTSGLDEATDRDIMALLRDRAQAGTTIVCVTHTLANVMAYCDRLIVMGRGGHLAFNGPPADALGFFEIERLGDTFDRLDEKGAEYWSERFLDTEDGDFGAAPDPAGAGKPIEVSNRPNPMRQFAILVHRNTRLVMADKRYLAMALIQSVMIGGLVGYAYSDLGQEALAITSRISLLMLLGMSSLWLGCNTSSTNIVGEALIFQRERDVSVSTVAFVLAKFTVSGTLAIFQVAIVFALTWLIAEEIPGELPVQFGFTALGALVGVALGLMISAVSQTQEQANTIVPLALIPQLVLAGVLVPALPEIGARFSEVAVSAYWLTEGLTSVYLEAEGPIMQMDLETGTIEEMDSRSTLLSTLALAGHAVAFLLLANVFALRRFGRKTE